MEPSRYCLIACDYDESAADELMDLCLATADGERGSGCERLITTLDPDTLTTRHRIFVINTDGTFDAVNR